MSIEAIKVEYQLGGTGRCLFWRGERRARLVAIWLPII
jgi:hypothetical protein